MKQHMLTHKIRDMPQHGFHDKSSSSMGSIGLLPPPNSHKEDSRNSHASSVMTLPERPENYNSCSSEPPSQMLERDRERERERELRERERELLPTLQQQAQHLPIPPDMPLMKTEMSLMKRSPPEAELPLPKRPPSK